MRYTSSRNDNWITPRQRRWDHWGHGPIEPMEDQRDNPMRGIINGMLLSIPIWGAVIGLGIAYL